MRRWEYADDPLLVAISILSAKWTLRIMLVLSDGPARFSGIRAAIPSVSANILAARLRDLEAAGIIRKDMLPPPADCQVYALTNLGEAGRPMLLAIAQWASYIADNDPKADRPRRTARKAAQKSQASS